jgi:hypothetical protein
LNKILTLTFLVACSQVSALEISNFKSGQMCGINKDDMGWVCFESEEIYVTGQSSCQSQDRIFKCTWYGYSFEYSGAKQGQEISCKYTTSKPVYGVSLDSADSEPSTTSTYTFGLQDEEGYFVNPQYSALRTSGSSRPQKLFHKAECSSEGKRVFDYQFISIYPPDP